LPPSGRSKGAVDRQVPGWLMTWQLWLAMAIFVTGGAGSLATLTLVRLPQVSDCPRMFWPLASASLRIYCAQSTAETKTANGLLDAIGLIEAIPVDHPLRPQVDRYLQRWSLDLIDATEALFQDGKLNEALASLKRIPLKRLPCTTKDCPRKEVERRGKRWQKIWAEAEKIFKEAEKSLIQQEWNKAAEVATLLLSVDNRYWRTAKYDEISQQIQDVRGTNSQLAKARDLAENGDADSLAKAIDLVSSIPPTSRLYPVAQGAIAKFSRKLLDLAEVALDRKDYSEALAIIDKIPSRARLDKDIRDFKTLAQAQSQTWSGTVSDIQAAIAQAKSIGADRPLYSRAQKLASRWARDIEDIARLERARTIAAKGQIPDLMTAIAEVSLIPQSNPRWKEAQDLMDGWTAEVETREDQPVLAQAEQYAQANSLQGYQAAIAEASRIRSGRALHKDAQNRVSEWSQRLASLRDQPFLDQARQLALSGNLSDAIAVAQRIPNGSGIYDSARTEIESWQTQLGAEQYLTQARQSALRSGDNPDSIVTAIQLADRVPRQSALRYEADLDIEDWSNRLLQIAQGQADYDINAAIAIAGRVPQGTDAYNAAQQQIQLWQSQIAAPVPEPIAPDFEPPPLPPQ
jgi:hypothetical protein